jgi:hypothetical protein
MFYHPAWLAKDKTAPMDPIWVGLITFCCITAGMVVGRFIRSRVPSRHLGTDTTDTIKLATSIVATLSALVLGLLLAFSESSFRTKDDELTHMSSDLIRVHRMLLSYGPEAAKPDAMLLAYAEQKRRDLFPDETGVAADPLDSPTLDQLSRTVAALLELHPADARQTWLLQAALRLTDDIAEKRWLLVEQEGQLVPMPLLVMLVFWMTLIFTSFGLLSPGNPVAVGSHLLCAVAIAAAVTMILDMSTPFSGPVRLSEGVLRNAIVLMQQQAVK